MGRGERVVCVYVHKVNSRQLLGWESHKCWHLTGNLSDTGQWEEDRGVRQADSVLSLVLRGTEPPPVDCQL